MKTVIIDIPQKLEDDFIKLMKIRLAMKDVISDINPADAIYVLVARELTKENKGEICAAVLACEYCFDCDGVPENHPDYCPVRGG